MSQQRIKDAIENKTMLCPSCNKPVQKFEKYIEMADQVWDGAGDSNRTEFAGAKVTLICGNSPCEWRERTEYWNNYIND